MASFYPIVKKRPKNRNYTDFTAYFFLTGTSRSCPSENPNHARQKIQIMPVRKSKSCPSENPNHARQKIQNAMNLTPTMIPKKTNISPFTFNNRQITFLLFASLDETGPIFGGFDRRQWPRKCTRKQTRHHHQNPQPTPSRTQSFTPTTILYLQDDYSPQNLTLLDLHALTEISHTEYNRPHKNRSQGMRLQHVRQRTARHALNEPLHLAGRPAR